MDWSAAKTEQRQWTPRARRSDSLPPDQMGLRLPESPSSRMDLASPSQLLRKSNSRTISAVQVVVRFRPPVMDDEQQDSISFSIHPNGRSVPSADSAYVFDFNKAFGEAATQDDIFEAVGKPIVSDVLSGYNGTILAYGQTSSGKTHSMYGPGNVAIDSVPPDLQGIVPKASRFVFDHIEASVDYDTEITLRCSFMEVYKEKMQDLLRPNSEMLRVKELPQRGLFVDGLSREYVTCASDVMAVIRAGLRTRAVGRTRCNNYSSRSHVVFVLHVEQQSLQGEERLGKLTLVDLAGSEKLSKNESVGETFEEAKKINWSLSALGKVIDALAEQRSHVPYRDSKLTRVLQEALGGNCRTTLLVAASPFSQHADETLSSLRFATRAKSVRNIAKVNYTYSPEQLLVLVGKLHKQLLGANQHIIELGGLPQEAPTHDADKCATLAATSSTRSLRRPSSGKSFFIPEEASSVHGSDSLRPVGIELSEPDLTQAVPGAQKEDDEEEDMEAMSWHLYDEVFKPFALSAQKAMGAMEDALLAQEQALAEVRLRHAQREDAGHDRPTPSYSSSRPGLEEESREANLLSERFRALRHAVESRSLRWRLQVEKHRAEQLVIELQMRDKFQKELEESLAEARTRIAEAEELSAARAKASTASSGTGNTPAPRSPPGSSGGNSAASRREKPRIVRPVPRTRNTRGSPTRSKTMSLDVPKEVLSPLVSPNASRIPTPSARAEDVLWVAGTGDTGGEASGSSTLESSCETAALASTSVDAKAQGASMDVDVRASMQGEAVQTDLKQQALLERRSSKLRDLMGELQSKDLQISALRHQIRIKDALLGCLQDEERFRFETLDSELEALLEKALSPLTAILTREQTARTAVATPRPAGPSRR